jgi:hypothetical protein
MMYFKFLQNKMNEKVTKIMKIENKLNSDLKEGICTEKNICLIFYTVFRINYGIF